MLTAFQETRSIDAWSVMHGVPTDAIRSRLRRRWTPEEAVTAPIEQKKSLKMQAMGRSGAIARLAKVSKERRKEIARLASAGLNGEPYTITYGGKTGTLHQWGEWTGIKPGTLYMRIFVLNWTEEEALTKPVRRKG
jgi:hypothetical protein